MQERQGSNRPRNPGAFRNQSTQSQRAIKAHRRECQGFGALGSVVLDLEDEGVVEDGVLAGGVLGRALEDEGAGEAGWVTEAPPDLAPPKEALD